MQTKFIKS